MIEAGGEEEGREDEGGQLGEEVVPRQLVDRSQAIAPFDGGGNAGAGDAGLPRAQGEHETAAGLDGGGGDEVDAVAVVVDAVLRGQAAHAAQTLAAREDLVRAVHLADGQAEAETRPLLRRGAEAVGADLDGEPVPGVGLARPGMAAPAQGHVRPRPGRIVVVVLRPPQVVARLLAPVHRERDRPVEGGDGEVGIADAIGLGEHASRTA